MKQQHEAECWDNEKPDPGDWPQYCICDRLRAAYQRGKAEAIHQMMVFEPHRDYVFTCTSAPDLEWIRALENTWGQLTDKKLMIIANGSIAPRGDGEQK